MYAEFVLHGADQGTMAEAKSRRIVVDIKEGEGQNARDLIDQVMEDDLAKEHVALARTFHSDAPLPDSSITIESHRASPRSVLGAIKMQTRDKGVFQSFVNHNEQPSFMMYRLANHLVDVITSERQEKGLSIPKEKPEEKLALEELQSALNDLPSLKDLPRAIQNQVHSLKTSAAHRLDDHEPKHPQANQLDRDRKYLAAAIEFGSTDGDFKFLNRSVDLELDSRSVLCDTDGTPLPFFRDRVQEILTSQFPNSMGKTVELSKKDLGDSLLNQPSNGNKSLRILFADIEGPRMQRALKMIQDELTVKDEPDLLIRGSGNAIINEHINNTPDRRLPRFIAEFQKHVPSIYANRLDREAGILRKGAVSSYRKEEDLLVEARAFIEENAQQFEPQYR